MTKTPRPKRGPRPVAVALTLAMALAPAAPHASPLVYFATVPGTDYVFAAAGGLRGTGTTRIELRGVVGPPSRAILYWHGPTDEGADGPLSRIQFNGTEVRGTHIGISDDNRWTHQNSQAYRADVTGIVTGDGTYTVSGILPDRGNGASLMVFFDDGDPTNDRDIVIIDGNDSNMSNAYDPDGWSFGVSGLDYRSGEVELELHVSDGQDFGPSDDGVLTEGGDQIATGGTFQGRTVPSNPRTSVRNGGLWDVRRFDLRPRLADGKDALRFGLGQTTDALSLIAAVINLPAGAGKAAAPFGAVTVIHYGYRRSPE